MRTMSGLPPKEEPAPTASPVSNFISSEATTSTASASDLAVQHTLELLKGKRDIPMILSGPSPQAAPVPAQPINKKAQLTEPPKERELTEKEKREQEEAALEAMTSIEER
jgi:hypothetical protein